MFYFIVIASGVNEERVNGARQSRAINPKILNLELSLRDCRVAFLRTAFTRATRNDGKRIELFYKHK